MPLSTETIAALEATKEAVQDFLDTRLEEIDAQAEALRSLKVSFSTLSESSTSRATDEALETISSILTEV